MESSTTSLTFKGSISEAITESQLKRKIFLVYISGQDEDSVCLEQSTWKDSNVAESISRHCVFLHLIDGSVEALQFSSIYPQKCVPSISAIGYNGGRLLLHYEGYVGAEELVTDIEKTLESLHLQETAAAFLTAAALSSSRPQHSNPASNIAPVEQASSSSTSLISTSSTLQGTAPSPLATLELEGDGEGSEHKAVQRGPTLSQDTSSNSMHIDQSENGNYVDDLSISVNSAPKESGGPFSIVVETSEAEPRTIDAEDGCTAPQENIMLETDLSGSAPPPAFKIVRPREAEAGVQETKLDELVCAGNIVEDIAPDKKFVREVGDNSIKVEDGTIDKNSEELTSHAKALKSTDAYLHIRLPDGTTLQAKFLMTDTLRSVKNYVDENGSTIGQYDLAIPYPRKVFNEQDMNRSLSELGFVNREALIVVPHRSASGVYNARSSSHELTTTTASNADLSSDNNGLFGYAKRLLAAINPFSYVGGGGNPSSSGLVSNDDSWQYRPNPDLRNSLSGRSYSPYQPNINSPPAGGNITKGKKVAPAQFGSNIHTLKDDEDDGRFSDRNAFWNGNSTQYGGDNDK